MKKGFMVVIDGSNGAGKTTVINEVKRYLKSKGIDVILTREPGGTPIGEKIRNIMSNTWIELNSTTRSPHILTIYVICS